MLVETLKTLAKKVRNSFFMSLILAGLVFSAPMIKANVPIELNFNPETKSYESNENFSWGVLAINSNKATYLPNETAQLEFAVLDEKGAMVCNAELNLTVTKPDGQTQLLSTKTGEIKINQAVCRSYALTEVPDYEANYLLTNPGEYQLSLEAITKNGTHLITSKIEVKEKANFIVERQATTRVYPINKYPVKILVTPQEDYRGTVEEPIPKNFDVFAINHGGQKLNDTISWEVAWQAGQTYELEYTFDTPDKNPAFYTTGPLKIGADFSENRSWQLAVDAVLTYVGGVEISGSSNGGGGWVELTDQIGADTRDANMSVSYKIMGATPDSSIPVNSAITTAFGSTSVVHIWRNVDQNNPIDVTTTTATAANSAVFDSPAITPVTAGAQVLSIGLSTAAANAGDTDITAPSGYGNQVDNNGNGSTASVQAGIASKAWSGSGAENPAAWTNITTTTSDSWVAATVALRPNGTLTYVGGAENSGTTPYSIDISGLSPQEGDIVIVVTGWSHTTNGDPGVRLYDLDLSGLSMQEGDLVIVATGWSHTTDGNPEVYTNGYSELTDQVGADTRDANLSINYKIMGATPDSGVTCYGSGYQSPVYGDLCLAHVWRGADPTTPIDVTTTTATAANSAVFDSPAITPVTTGAQVLSIGLSTAAASAGDTTITAPTDYTNQLDHNSNGTTHSIQAGIASKAWSGSGAENPAAWTNITTTTSDSWVAATLAIRPFIETDIDISGTANGNDGATVRVAINGSVQAQTGTISGSAWTISGVTTPTADDIITVWVDNVADNLESTAVTKYSAGDVTGMVLDTNVTTIGSDQNTGLTVTNLNAYDCTEDEDIMYQAASSTLLVEGNNCADSTTNSYSAEELEILSGDSLTIGGTETLTTYDLTITGTLTSSGNATYNIAHNWANTGTFTSDTSTVNLTGADSSTQTISGSTSFYNLAISTASNSAGRTITHTAGTTQTVTGTWTVTGYSGKVITLGSSNTSAWTINPTTASVTYADVSYSTNSGTSFCATYTTNSGNNTNWTIVSDSSCPSTASSAYSFQRKTWYDGTRYWRSFQDTTDNRIEFEYSIDGSSWTENTSARIDVDTDDFSIYGDSTNTYIAYKTAAVTNEDNLLQGNLVGFWKLDESSTGTCSGGLDSCDASGNNYHGDWINNATNTTGKFNNAITVDGTGDYVQISESDSDGALDHSNGDTITVSAWIKPTALPPADNWDTYVGKNGADDGWFLQLDETGNIEWFIWNNPGWAAFVTTTQPITVGEWNQVTISQTLGTGSSLKIYVNGIEQPFSQSGTANLYPDLNNYAVSIGGNSDGSEEANGAIDDVRIYSSILTAKQVEQLANPGYDIEVRKASSYPGTSFSWSNPEISFNGSASTDYYQYPTITQDTNSKIWTTAHYYSTGTITDLQTVADNDDGADVVGSSNFYSVGTPDSWDTGTQIAVGGVDYSNNNITTGFRWQKIPIPQKATISSASFDLYDSWGGNYGTEMKTNVYGAKVSNLSSFSAINLPRNITKTTASVAWDSTSDGSPHTWFSTSTGFIPPAITSIIQEIVDQPDWNKNNSLGILIDDDGSTTAWWWAAYTHENGASTAPKFSASYTASQIQAIQTTNANDITSWNSLTILDQSTNTNKYGVIVPKNSGAMAAIWLDGSTIESKNFDGNNWDTTATVATGNTGLTKSISAVADSSGNIHLVYINSSNQTIYQEYTSSWQTAVTLDSNSGNEYPTIAYNTTNNNLFAFWVRGGNIIYKEGTSDYTSGNWDAVATDWQTTGSNIYLTSNYSGNNNIFVEWTNGSTLSWDKLSMGNSTPATPSLDTPSDTATNQILSTVLKTTTTDTDSDYLRYKIELCEDSGMSSNCQTFDQTSSQTGWSGQDAQTSTAYASGTQATYTLQTPLNLNTTYYWRSYAIDPAGTNSWSSTQGSPYSFTTAAAPVISSVSVNNGEAITLTEGTTTTISWVGTVTDADGHTNISSAQGVIYRSGVTNAETCTPNNENCYVAASCNLSGCAGNSCTATCSVNLEFFANPTDSASLYPTEYWRGWIEATDANSNTGEGWSVATTTDVESLAAMSVTSSIAYGPLLPGDDTGSSNQTTVVTNTGNTILDLEISGDNFCTDYPTCAGYQIPVGYQEYNTSTFTYGLGNALSSTPTSAQINLAKSTLNPANSTTNIYWGLGIPTPKEDGAYSGSNTLTAVDGD